MHEPLTLSRTLPGSQEHVPFVAGVTAFAALSSTHSINEHGARTINRLGNIAIPRTTARAVMRDVHFFISLLQVGAGASDEAKLG